MRLMPLNESDFWLLFAALVIVCMMASVSGCLGVSKKDSNTKSVKNKHERTVEWKAPVTMGPVVKAPVIMEFKSWEKESDSNTKDKSSSVDVSGMLLPAIGIGLLLISAGLFFLNQQTGGILKRVNRGIVSLWDTYNTKVNLSTPGSTEYASAQEGKAMLEAFAAEHNIKI